MLPNFYVCFVKNHFFVNYKINQFFQKTPFFADFSLV